MVISTRPRGRAAALVTAVVVAGLAGVNLADHEFGLRMLWLGPPAAATLLIFARVTGLTWAQLGLGRGQLRSGVRWAAAAIAAVAAVYGAAVLVPATREAFLDSRYHEGVSGTLLSAFVVIPMGTVLLEEIGFRSVLWASLARHAPTWRVLATSSVLFGLWHVLPSLQIRSANPAAGHALAGAGAAGAALIVTGTVAVTALGGAVAGELRRRSGSLVASAGMHWATNSLGVLFGLLAWHLAR